MGFVAGKRLYMGDGRWIEPGEPVPEATDWKNQRAWIDGGYIVGAPDPPTKAAAARTTVAASTAATTVVSGKAAVAARGGKSGKARGGQKGKTVADKKDQRNQRKAQGDEHVPRTSPDTGAADDLERDVLPGDATGGTPAATPEGRLRAPVQGDVLESEAQRRGETLEETNEALEEQQEDVAPTNAEQKPRTPRNAREDDR